MIHRSHRRQKAVDLGVDKEHGSRWAGLRIRAGRHRGGTLVRADEAHSGTRRRGRAQRAYRLATSYYEAWQGRRVVANHDENSAICRKSGELF